MKLLLFSVLALICVASAQYRCSTPPVWEGMLNEYITKGNVSIPWGKFSYDSTNRRVRILEIVNANGTSQTLDVLFYQRCKTAFIFDLKTKKCNRVKADIPWKPVEIPEGSHFLGFGYLGSAGIPGGGLEVQTRVGRIPGMSYTTTFTKHGCLPITMAANSEKLGIVALNMYNIVLGVQDPNVFKPRKECFEQNQVLPEDMVYVTAEIPMEQVRGNRPITTSTTERPRLYRLIRERANRIPTLLNGDLKA